MRSARGVSPRKNSGSAFGRSTIQPFPKSMFRTLLESSSEIRVHIYDKEGCQLARFDKEATNKERAHHEVRCSHILPSEVD